MENVTVKLSNGKVVVLRGYISGRDQLKMREIIFSEGGTDIKENPALTQKAFTGLMQDLLISYDGSTDNVYESLLDAPAQDFDTVFNRVVEIQSANNKKDEHTKKGKATGQSS